MTDRIIPLAFAAALSACAAGPRATPDPTAAGPARSRVANSHALPPLDGHNLRTTAVEITYQPGASTPAHSHPCPVLVYVIEGAIRTRVHGEREAVYRAGQAFFEPAHGIHELSANASQREPARFLAVFVCDRDTPLTTPPPTAAGSRS
jgi:quercetin dioxygenase-like cupin family protein